LEADVYKKSERERGIINEAKVERALRILKKEWDKVVDFHHSVQSGELDSLHVDFLIFLDSRLAFPLQVKSSFKKARQHIKKYPYIEVIAVGDRQTDRQIADFLKSLIIRRCIA